MRKLFLFASVIYFLIIGGGMYLNDAKVILTALICAGITGILIVYIEEINQA